MLAPYHRQQSPRAFTLVEILVVVVILGIASAVIVPQISTRDDLKAAAGARVLMADLIYAQNRSITMQNPHYVQFSSTGYSIWAKDPKNPSAPAAIVKNPLTKEDYTVTFGTGSLADISLSAVTLDSGKMTLSYNELGVPQVCDSPGDALTQMVSNGSLGVTCGSFTMAINIEAYTGELTVP